jgi:uncharacterized Zn finger protein
MPLQDILTLKTVREMADERSFARGLAYFHEGAVGLLRERKGVLHADVSGSYLYHVTLSESLDGELEHDCTCPVGQDGDFCKHAVAVALSWLENSGEESFPPEGESGGARSGKPRKKRKTQADTISDYLNTLPEAALKDWLMEAASRDKGIRDKLLLNARVASGGKKNASGLSALRSALLKAARQSVFLDWQQAEDFAERLHDAAQLIEERIPLGEPGLPAIIEEMIQQAESSLENVDDSNGAVQEALRRLGEAHLAACCSGRPDPVELAERLFMTELSAEWDFFPPTLPAYAEVLGESGLGRYRQLLMDAAEKLPIKNAKAVGINASGGDLSNYSIERMMDRLCKHEGNDAPMLRLMEKNLDSAYRYLQLAERHEQAGRHQQALEWAERGLAKFPNEYNAGLIDFCIDLQREHGKPERANELAWRQFAQSPHYEAWLRLLKHTPEKARGEVKQRGITHLEALMQQEESAPKKPSRNYSWNPPGARSTLVQIHLREKNTARVWELASGHAIANKLWPAVAKMRGETHPDEAIAIYRKLLPDAIRQGQGNARYDEAFDLVTFIRTLRLKQGKKDEFRHELTALKAEYKAKRNFIKRLDILEP